MHPVLSEGQVGKKQTSGGKEGLQLSPFFSIFLLIRELPAEEAKS